jgi:hypothetical protein
VTSGSLIAALVMLVGVARFRAPVASVVGLETER